LKGGPWPRAAFFFAAVPRKTAPHHTKRDPTTGKSSGDRSTRTRQAYVFRQFHSEGFVNQYVCAGPETDGKTFIFLSEAIENIPPGFKARLTYRILDDSRSEQTFDLAPPGQEMSCYSKGVMTRKGSTRPAAATAWPTSPPRPNK
jgi:hypothetical protein